MCQQVFSEALIAYVEAHYNNEAQKNDLCQPVPHPEEVLEYLFAMKVTLANSNKWARRFGRCLMSSRLCVVSHRSKLKLLLGAMKMRELVPQAEAEIRQLIEQEVS